MNRIGRNRSCAQKVTKYTCGKQDLVMSILLVVDVRATEHFGALQNTTQHHRALCQISCYSESEVQQANYPTPSAICYLILSKRLAIHIRSLSTANPSNYISI